MAGNAVQVTTSHTATGQSTTISKLGQPGGPVGKGFDNLEVKVQITGTFTGTVKVIGSEDGSTYVDWITGITSPGLYIIDNGPMYLTTSCTAYTSGTINATITRYVKD